MPSGLGHQNKTRLRPNPHQPILGQRKQVAGTVHFMTADNGIVFVLHEAIAKALRAVRCTSKLNPPEVFVMPARTYIDQYQMITVPSNSGAILSK